MDTILKEKLENINKLVSNEFENIFQKSSTNLLNTNENPIVEAIKYSLFSGGKRLRPFIFLQVCEILEIKNQDLIKIACAIECIHTYSLIHDDLPTMDNDDYRRGQLTSHKKFGESTAILAGDALLTMSFEILSILENISANKKCKIIEIITKSIGFNGMCLGQYYDLEYEKNRKLKTEEKATFINKLKTGYLFNTCVEAAIILYDKNDEKSQNLLKFINNFGLAFQLKDDLEDGEIIEKNIEFIKENINNLVLNGKNYLKIFTDNEKVKYFNKLIDYCFI